MENGIIAAKHHGSALGRQVGSFQSKAISLISALLNLFVINEYHWYKFNSIYHLTNCISLHHILTHSASLWDDHRSWRYSVGCLNHTAEEVAKGADLVLERGDTPPMHLPMMYTLWQC